MRKNDEQKTNKLKRKSGNSVVSQYCDAAGGRFPDSGYWCAGSWYYLLQ